MFPLHTCVCNSSLFDKGMIYRFEMGIYYSCFCNAYIFLASPVLSKPAKCYCVYDAATLKLSFCSFRYFVFGRLSAHDEKARFIKTAQEQRRHCKDDRGIAEVIKHYIPY